MTRSLLVLTLLASIASGCGHSEDEWQAKLKQIDGLHAQLSAERKAHAKVQDDYAQAKNQVGELGERLKQAGVDVEQLNASLAEQRKALEEFKQRSDQLEAIRKRFEMLRSKLNSLVKLGLSVDVRNNRMVISMPGDVLFDSGKTDLKKDGKEILAKVASVIRTDPQLNARNFQVAGHTDNRPLRGSPYKDNWGLSVMRARQVLVFLVNQDDDGGKLTPHKWSAAGYGETDPIDSNNAEDGRRRNRRVELIVLPDVEEMLNLQSLTR